jgi:hypothetical protein
MNLSYLQIDTLAKVSVVSAIKRSDLMKFRCSANTINSLISFNFFSTEVLDNAEVIRMTPFGYAFAFKLFNIYADIKSDQCDTGKTLERAARSVDVKSLVYKS